MRSILLLSIAGLLLGACSSDNAASPPPAPVDWHAFDLPRHFDAGASGVTVSERQVAEQYAAALASPGFAALGPKLDALDAHFSFPGAADARAREAVVQAHDKLLGAFDNRAVVVSRVWRTANAQAVEWTLTGVQTKDWMGVAPTNKPVVIRGISLLSTKDDGTITDVHVVFDTALVKAQLGVGPKELLALPPPTVPSGAPQVFDKGSTPEEDGNIAIVRSWIDALEGNSDAAYLAPAADDVILETLERAQPMHGKDDLRAYFKAMHKAIGQLDTTVNNTWGIGRFVVVDYAIAGEQIAPLGWIPAQRDKVFRLDTVSIAELANGKIAHVWRYDNPGQMVTGSSP
jgi:SnoaL-like domain/SnoaL-like polyketide cyclase